jgi:NNP family nitrate/nitrite transporter-like MFS transporter
MTNQSSSSPVTGEDVPEGASRVLTLSTIGFTLMFAVWLMFGILSKTIQKDLGLSDLEVAWLLAVASVNGSLWRLPSGMLTDWIGGRRVFALMMALCAVPTYLVSHAQSYGLLMVLAFLVGFVGNSFTVGIAWNSAWYPQRRQGFALGVFGAGNVGASVTKLLVVLVPSLVTVAAGHKLLLGFIDGGGENGGWRLIPVIYSVLLLLLAIVIWFTSPRPDRYPGNTRPLAEQILPLKLMRVWRFSLYYVIVFGAYVALSSWLPKYYQDNYDTSLRTAALLTATFIIPASLLRPLGGWFSDQFGARRAMYWTFGVMLLALLVLCLPEAGGWTDSAGEDVLPITMSLAPFAIILFILGCGMGIGKAAVYKHIPTYFPHDVGSVGGLVGMIGGLGGFFLPLMWGYTDEWTDIPSSTFFILFVFTALSLLWMNRTVIKMLHQQSPQLVSELESPPDTSTKA